MIEEIKNSKASLIRTIRQMSDNDKRNLFRLDSKLLTLWHEASDKGRLEIIITAVAGLIAGIFIFFLLLR
jgi:hypothetical protein